MKMAGNLTSQLNWPPCPSICSSRMMGVSKLTEEEGKIRQKRKEEFRGKVDDIFFLVFPGRNSIEYQQRY